MIAHRKPVSLFLSYAHEDESLLNKLETHLSLLKRQGFISTWHDRLLQPGKDWTQEVDEQLNQASVILLLISADFLASDYCYGIEMKRALDRQEAGDARVIPIVLRSVDWLSAPFAHLQALPTNAKPITTWDNLDEAFADVSRGIRRTIEEYPLLSTTTSPTNLPAIWNIPYSRNPFFTGCDEILSRIFAQFQKWQVTATMQPLAICGLGGIGKTQIAIEYAYLHCLDYQTVFWVHANTHDALISGYMEMAHQLKIPQKKDEQDEMKKVEKVLQWLETHEQWLLILDNADDLTIVHKFLPRTFGGHLLLTTQSHSTRGLAYRIEVDIMDQEVGALLLLRRASLIEQNALLKTALLQEVALAKKITQELGGLPLALDQAGAYIEETQCSLLEYQDLYYRKRTEILNMRGGLRSDHPEPIFTTWSLSFQKVKQQNLAAADLLQFCAYLAPDAIPEEIITKGASHLGKTLAPVAVDPFFLNQAITVLQSYSLMHREPRSHMLTIHRLVQMVLRESMPLEQARIWMQRSIFAVSAAFPTEESKNWSLGERCLPHALHCASWLTQKNFNVSENTHLLDQIGTYLVERRRLEEAEPLLLSVVMMNEQIVDLADPYVVVSLNNLARMYGQQGKLAEAVSLYWRALTICEHHLNSADSLTMITLNNIIYFCNLRWDLNPLWMRASAKEEVRVLEKRTATLAEALAKTIYKQTESSTDPMVIDSLDSLAQFFLQIPFFYHVELLYRRLLSIYEQQLDPIEPMQMITCLNGLALACVRFRDFMEAEKLYQRALIFCEKHLSSIDSTNIFIMKNLMDAYVSQWKYIEAEELYQRILTLLEKIPNPKSHDLESLEFYCLGVHFEMQEFLENGHILDAKRKEHEIDSKIMKRYISHKRRKFLRQWNNKRSWYFGRMFERVCNWTYFLAAK